MSAAHTGMTSGEIVDITAMGLLANEALSDVQLLENIKQALYPHLCPTSDVIHGRLLRSLANRQVEVVDGRLVLTDKGRAVWRDLMLTPMSEIRHDLAPLCEALKIAFLQALDIVDQEKAGNDLIVARAKCLSEQKRLLNACERTCPQIARCRLHQFLMAETAFDRLRLQLGQQMEHET